MDLEDLGLGFLAIVATILVGVIIWYQGFTDGRDNFCSDLSEAVPAIVDYEMVDKDCYLLDENGNLIYWESFVIK